MTLPIPSSTRLRLLIGATAFSLTLTACGSPEPKKDEEAAASKSTGEKVVINPDPYPSTYVASGERKTLIKNATVLDGIGGQFDGTDVRLADGKIVEFGKKLKEKKDETIVDGTGKWVTPGIIDVHSHLGSGPSPSVSSQYNVNESTGPSTAEVWIEHSVTAKDPGFLRARAGGVTALQILPGSANLFGGRSAVLKNVNAITMQDMKFPGAPYGIKMACGENPKRVYGSKGGPKTVMGNVAGYRASWIKAQEYDRKWKKYYAKLEAGEEADAPARDLEFETLAGVLNGEILVHMHCYQSHEMVVMIDVMKEFGYQIASFQHAVESYKIRDRLAANNICSAMWPDWWGFKMESYDGIPENIALVHEAGACAIVHSDSEVEIQRLNQEAAKALAAGQRTGVEATKADAWTWLSANPAKSLGIFDLTGSLEAGKQADVVLWNGDPFSVYTKAEKVYIDGTLHYDLYDKATQPLSDFELGQHLTGQAQ